MLHRPRPLALIILDGWGYRKETHANAIAQAHTPYWDKLCATYPHTLISGCGRCVGLPDGQMGNSEVGHLNIGAGRVVHQDLTRIDLAIETGDFFANLVLVQAIDHAVQANKTVHILGLLSPGGVHSHENHFYALLKIAAERQATRVYFHVFLDGRDTPPQSAAASLAQLTYACEQLQCGQIASLIGRYYAMDRDKRWDRVQIAYDLLTAGKADYTATDALAGLTLAYDRGETDEFVKATWIQHGQPITENDTVIFMNFRADRARELTHALTDPTFSSFQRTQWPHNYFVSLTEYDANLTTPVAFAPERLNNILGEYLSNLGLTQLRIAETEKYAHVTFFFNGGIETPYPGEERLLIASPRVKTYDLQPEMSAVEITDELLKAINSQRFDVIICNFANPDMVGHTGNLPATIKAIETIDHCLSRIIPTLQAVGGEALITADHGNAELMFDEDTGQPHTAHTTDLVPFIYVGRSAKVIKSNGVLSDIAPTLLYLLNLAQPQEMTGTPIVELQ